MRKITILHKNNKSEQNTDCKGYKGSRGCPGSKGSRGCRGSDGEPGDSQVKGEKGNKGPTGPQGLEGTTGLNGLKGDKGIPGSKGIKGIIGIKGETGESFEIFKVYPTEADLLSDPQEYPDNISQFVTVVDDNSIYIYLGENKGNKGINNSYIFVSDFSVIDTNKGNKGIKGIEGQQGNEGLKGIQGIKGPSGHEGSTGSSGNLGPKGEPGSLGNKGSAGSKGDPGVKGPKGYQGNDGVPGSKGQQGDDGTQGVAGVKGDPGSSQGYWKSNGTEIYYEKAVYIIPSMFEYAQAPVNYKADLYVRNQLFVDGNASVEQVSYKGQPWNLTNFRYRDFDNTLSAGVLTPIDISNINNNKAYPTLFYKGDKGELNSTEFILTVQDTTSQYINQNNFTIDVKGISNFDGTYEQTSSVSERTAFINNNGKYIIWAYEGENQVVTSITINNGGTGYTSAPTVSFSGGGGGTGAEATAIIVNNKVNSITVTNTGGNYMSTPTVSFSGGGGAGAEATAVLDGINPSCWGLCNNTDDPIYSDTPWIKGSLVNNLGSKVPVPAASWTYPSTHVPVPQDIYQAGSNTKMGAATFNYTNVKGTNNTVGVWYICLNEKSTETGETNYITNIVPNMNITVNIVSPTTISVTNGTSSPLYYALQFVG